MTAETTENPAPEAATQARPPRWAWLVATLAGLGHLGPGPGTWASAVTVLLWWLVARSLAPEWRATAAILWAAAAILLGIPAATRVARAAGSKDPQRVVVDEMAGQMCALVAAPLGWKTLLASLILFRGFDIVKPPPVKQLERLPGGAGIVLDDVGAGLYALLALQLLLRFGLLS